MTNDESIDLTMDYLGAVVARMDSYVSSARIGIPDGALLIRDWLSNAASIFSVEQLSRMLHEAEMNGDFNLSDAEVYEEAEAIEVINRIASYAVESVSDDFGFDYGPAEKRETRVAPEEFGAKQEAPGKPVDLSGVKITANPGQQQRIMEAIEKNESLSGLGTALEDGADIELPFEKWRKKHGK